MKRSVALCLALLLPVSGAAQTVQLPSVSRIGTPVTIQTQALPASDLSALPAGPEGLALPGSLGALEGLENGALGGLQGAPLESAGGLGGLNAAQGLGELGAGLEAASLQGSPLSGSLDRAFDGLQGVGSVDAYALPALNAAGERATDLPDTLVEGKPEDVLELRFLGAHSKSLFKSERTGTVRVVKETKGSKRYWNKFKVGAEVGVVAGGSVIMRTKVTRGVTLPIRKLTKKDLKGVFTEKEIALLGIGRLRQALIDNLSGFSQGGNSAPIGLDTKVRLIQFEPYSSALAKTAPPPVEGPTPRTPLKIAADSPLHQLNQSMPKTIWLDLDMYEDAVPAETLADMAKLQRTGVMFVALSRQPLEGPDGAQEKLFKNMTNYQRDVLLPYRFVGVFEGGADIRAFERGGRTKPLARNKFSDVEAQLIEESARRVLVDLGLSQKVLKIERSIGVSTLKVPEKSAEEFRSRMVRSLKRAGLTTYLQTFTSADGSSALRVSKTHFGGSAVDIQKALQDAHSVYADGGEILALTKDHTLLRALPGTADVDALTQRKLNGPDLVENALGAALGEHRESFPTDVAGSASRMGSYLSHHNEYLDRYVLMQEDALRSIHFFSGHMVHKALDWAVHQLKHGRRPSGKQVKEKMREFWEAEDRGDGKPLGLAPGHKVERMLEASAARTETIYNHVRDITDQGYKLLGTEIPNFFMLKSYNKDGSLRRRYVIHTIFDLVAVKVNENGKAEVVILDFKSGPAQTMQKLAVDLQVLTYSLFLRYKWKELSAPYKAVGGRRFEIEKGRVEFLYSPVRESPEIPLWSLETIERKIIRTLDRMQKEQEMNIPKRRKSPKGFRG